MNTKKENGEAPDYNSLKKQMFAKVGEPEHEPVSLNGVKFDLRQPALRDIMKFQQVAEANRDEATGRILAQYSYWPGSDELVFTSEEDIQNLLSMPFNDEMIKISEALNKMAGVTGEASGAEENFEKTPGSKTSS